MVSAGLDIDKILHFVFYDKILQIYRQRESGNFTDTFCQNTDRFQIKWESVRLPSIAPPFGTPLTEAGKNSYIQLILISAYIVVETLNSALD